jgi:aspartate/methionine/tyrosine aminotransferase
MFSTIARRIRGESNALYRVRDEVRASGRPVVDLVSGNINECGYVFPQNLLEEILVEASRRAAIYRPDSFGQRAAREAVSEFYQRSGCALPPDSILVTPGTSLAYWYCFKLLADEGDEILCPRPSYPLFDYIALMGGVNLVPYRMREEEGWGIDLEHLEASISTRSRAVVLISPHNPTGHVASAGEIAGLAEIARRHDLAIISDEVFSEALLPAKRSLAPAPLPRPASSGAPLVITLNGFSKMFALPGMKFGWMALSGDREKVRQALGSLELIADTFLPVNETVQAAAPGIFQLGNSVRFEFGMRIRDCWRRTEALLAACSGRCSYVRPQGGFYVALSIGDLDEERAAERILRERGLLVHPGWFYDMDPHHLVFCFVQKPEVLEDGIPGLFEADRTAAGGPGRSEPEP